MIRGTGICTYIYHKNQVNVGKYTSIPYMDPMGTEGMVVWSDRTGAFHQKHISKRIQLKIKFNCIKNSRDKISLFFFYKNYGKVKYIYI